MFFHLFLICIGSFEVQCIGRLHLYDVNFRIVKEEYKIFVLERECWACKIREALSFVFPCPFPPLHYL